MSYGNAGSVFLGEALPRRERTIFIPHLHSFRTVFGTLRKSHAAFLNFT